MNIGKSTYNNFFRSPRNWAILSQAGFIIKSSSSLAFSVFSQEFSLLTIVYLLLWHIVLMNFIHVFLIVGFLRGWRWILYFGMTVGVIKLGTNLFVVSSPFSSFASLFLWSATCVAIFFELRRKIKPTPEAQQPRKKMLAPVLGIGLGLLLTMGPYLIFLCSFMSDGKYGGKAPDTTFEKRRRWAQKVTGYKRAFKEIEPWIEKSEMIRTDLGQVEDIAPIGSPNYYQSAFLDGAYAAMNLEVRGEKGTGILYLPFIDNVPNLWGSIGDAKWTFNGIEKPIHSTGQSYSQGQGYKEKYDEIMSLDVEKDSQEIIDIYNNIKGEFDPKTKRWHEDHEWAVINRVAQSVENVGDTDQAADLYLEVVGNKLTRSEEKWDRASHNHVDIDFVNIQKEVNQVLPTLQQVYEIAPNHRLFSFYVDERIKLWYLAELKQKEMQPPYNASQSKLKAWAQSTLGIFYEEAIKWIKEAKDLERIVGRVKNIYPHSSGHSEVSAYDGYYGAYMFLVVEGKKRKLRMDIDINESENHLPPIDLLAEKPRLPDSPLVVKSVRLQDDQEGVWFWSKKRNRFISEEENRCPTIHRDAFH